MVRSRAARVARGRLLVSVAGLLVAPLAAVAQHGEHGGMQPGGGMDMSATPRAGATMAGGPLGLPPSREGSGTSWLPDDSPMYMLAWRSGPWELDAMWNVFVQYVDEGGSRGGDQLGSVNWVMGMARRPLGGGEVRGRAMLSLEPWTLPRCGYPDLLATGELCHGAPLHDRQHPHDFPMELSAGWGRAVSGELAIDLYAALSGEPALGPVAFPHRISAMPSPLAPMTHHWLDSTHISFGVITAGLHGRRWKIEASSFNGREPDERRGDLDLGPLDSFSGRAWFLPDRHWSLQASAGFLRDAEAVPGGGPRIDVTRTTASATYHRDLGARGIWATTAAWGRNAEHGTGSNGLLLETVVDPDARNVVFARVEAAQKSGESLAIAGGGEELRWVAKASLTYVRQFPIALGADRSLLLGLGGGVSLDAVPSALESAYGTRWPTGFVLFVSARPGPMAMGGGMGPSR